MGLTRGHIKSHHQDQEGGGPWRLIKLTPEEAEDCYEVPREEYIEFVDKRRRCRRGGLEAHALEMSPETGRRPEVLRSVYSHASVARADGRPPHHRTRSGAILEVTRTPVSTGRAQQLEWQGWTARLAPVHSFCYLGLVCYHPSVYRKD